MKPITKAVLLEYAKWYLEAHRGLRWKRKYPKTKTEKKLSEKLLCVLLIRHQSYSFPLKKPFAKTVLVEFAKWYLEAHRGLRWKKIYDKIKREKNFSMKLLCHICLSLTDLQLYFMELFASPVFVESENRYFRSLGGIYSQRKYAQIKTKEKISDKCLSDLWVHVTEFHLFVHLAVC